MFSIPVVQRDTVHGVKGRVFPAAGPETELVPALLVDTDSVGGIEVRVRTVALARDNATAVVDGNIVTVVEFSHVGILLFIALRSPAALLPADRNVHPA